MKIMNKEVRLCLSCMDAHEVQTVEIQEENEFKKTPVTFNAVYEYCSNTEEYYQNEDQIKSNDISFKDAYCIKMDLLTSNEITAIRKKYDVSQKDFSDILGWGQATMARYENHQVQDEAHDEILRKLDNDPKWFIDLLNKNKNSISEKAFNKYIEAANRLFTQVGDVYLTDSIYAMYAQYFKKMDLTGNTDLNLAKTIEAINYIALNMENVIKVKLMKMLWYSDYLNYKRHGHSIDGLAYRAYPMGALPVGHDQIVLLNGVCFDEVLISGDIGYKFRAVDGFQVKELSREDVGTIDTVIRNYGHMNTDEIVAAMHQEEAYKCTEKKCVISYKFAKDLSID